MRAVHESLVADVRAAFGDLHHRGRDVLEGVVFDDRDVAGDHEVRVAEGTHLPDRCQRDAV